MTRVALQIPPGVIVDDTAFEVGQSGWVDGDKVRFWRAEPQLIGGWEKLSTDKVTGVCRTAFPWTDNLGQLNIAFGTHSNLHLWTGGSLYDITPAAFVPGQIDGSGGSGYGTGDYGVGDYGEPSTADYFPLTWSLADYGQTLMANPRGQTIFQWSNVPATPAVALAGAPANVTYMLVAPTRQVMAFGCNEELSGTFNPRCIRFSDIEDPTDWTTAPDNNAGEVIIEGSGRIIAARLIGNYIFVWTDNGLYLGQFTGDSSQPWTFNQIGERCGLIGPSAAVVVAQQAAFWFGSNGQLYTCQLGGAPALLVCPLQADVFSNVTPSQQDKIIASSCAEFGEIRFDYPDARDGLENSRYFALSTLDNAWCKGMMVRTAYVDAGPTPYPIGVDVSGDIYWHELGQSADGTPISAFIESGDMYLGSAENTFDVMGMWPDLKSQTGTVNLTIRTQLYPQQSYRTKGPYALSPSQSKKDFRANGRIVRLRYESASVPSFWRLGKPVFDVVQTGTR